MAGSGPERALRLGFRESEKESLTPDRLIEQFQAWRGNNAGRLAPTGKAVSSGLYLLLMEDRA
jgi:hypothetical protein